MFVIVGTIAELERSLIVERIHSGLRRARAHGNDPPCCRTVANHTG
jgi:DNA invertase Pin-like site-specific DNA recombinase